MDVDIIHLTLNDSQNLIKYLAKLGLSKDVVRTLSKQKMISMDA